MSGEAWLFLLAVLLNAVNLFMQVFFTIMYSDLEWYGIPCCSRMFPSSSTASFPPSLQNTLLLPLHHFRLLLHTTPMPTIYVASDQNIMTDVHSRHSDYINPIDLCNRLNTYMVPEAAVHGFLTIMFLINGYWVALILNLPLAAFNAKKYVLQSIHAFPERREFLCPVWDANRRQAYVQRIGA